MNNQIYWGQTVGAAIVSVVMFFLLLYIAAPIIESLLNLYGLIFVPERYGGGSEVDNPGFLTLAFRAIVASSLAAVGAFMAGPTHDHSLHKLIKFRSVERLQVRF